MPSKDEIDVLNRVGIFNPRPETRDPRPETRDPRPETRDPRPETRDSGLG